MAPISIRSNADLSLRFLSTSIIIIILLVLIGCGLNDLNEKYAKYRSDTCRSGVLILNMQSSEFCCDDYLHQTEWICLAAYDRINKIMTSHQAFFIPLIPIIATSFTDIAILFATEGLVWKKAQTLCFNSFGRLSWSFALTLYRTYILYRGGKMIQKYLNASTHDSTGCWYAALYDGRCKDDFDYSDHIILYSVQYIFNAVIELDHVYQKRNSLRYFVSILITCALILFSLRAIFFTAMFFHTMQENAIALVVVIFGAYVPISNLIFNSKQPEKPDR